MPSQFFYIYQLITTYRRKHVPGIICFPNYAFHDYIHMFLFSKMKCFPNYIFSYDWHKNLRKSLLWILRKKKLWLVQFPVKFVMLPLQSITLADWFPCVPACTSTIAWISLTSLVTVDLLHHNMSSWCLFLGIVWIKMATDNSYFFTPLALLFMPEKCHNEFFVNFNFFHGKNIFIYNMYFYIYWQRQCQNEIWTLSKRQSWVEVELMA